jgi:hypothetical protein
MAKSSSTRTSTRENFSSTRPDAAVHVGHRKLSKQLRRAFMQNGETVAARFLRQGAGEPAFAASGGTDEQDILILAHPPRSARLGARNRRRGLLMPVEAGADLFSMRVTGCGNSLRAKAGPRFPVDRGRAVWRLNPLRFRIVLPGRQDVKLSIEARCDDLAFVVDA